MVRPDRRTILSNGRQETSSWWIPVMMLVGGLVMGSVVTYTCFVPEDGSTSTYLLLMDANTAKQQQPQQQQQAPVSSSTTNLRMSKTEEITTKLFHNDKEGWHPIHVFYGKKDGLQLDPHREWFAQVHQDEIVVDLLGENGYFIDLAANDAKELSNTVALEKHGWNGLCIEPNPMYWYDLSHRKCTVVGALVGGPTVERVPVKFRGVFGGILGRMDERLANRKREPDAVAEERYTAPLREVLLEYHVPPSIDYLSLDVEGAEFLIMQHFPFDEYTIRVLTVERPSTELKLLLEQHGYIMLKQLAWWGETLWAHTSTGYTPDHPKIVKIPTDEKK